MFTIENLENTVKEENRNTWLNQLSKDDVCKHSVIIPSRL